jgi:hypothetical protein
MTGPAFNDRLAILGYCSRAAQANFLGVSERTVDRFRAEGPSPMARRLLEAHNLISELRKGRPA